MAEVVSEIAAALEKDSKIEESGDFLFVSRQVDFLLIGGLAILLWLPLYSGAVQIGWIKSFADSLPAIAITLGFWVNYPHFMASYKLAYAQGLPFILGNKLQLIFAPLILLVLMALGFIFWDLNISGNAVVQVVNGGFESLGIQTRLGLYPNLSSEMLGFLVLVMYFTVGWHYSKQTFGCMMVYARIDAYPLSIIQRNLIRYSLLSTWWLTWLYSNCSVGAYPFYNITIHRLGLPYILFQISYIIVGVMFSALAIMFAIKIFKYKQRPSINFLTPMFALLIWHVPLFENPQYFVVVALFHSLQYFPFVTKVESARYKVNHRSYRHGRLLGFYLIMVILGFLSFEYLPKYFDSVVNVWGQVGSNYFLIAFILFINIHHYFIDNALWRFKNKEVRELLFSRE